MRRILTLAGYRPRPGWPGPSDLIGVWGHSPYARRGEAVARRTGASLVRIEDAFLRSLHPGRAKEPPMGLVIDHAGMHYDPDSRSELETLLSQEPLDDADLLARARGCISRLAEAHLSKYSATDPDAALPAPGYVLVIDQTRGDASVTQGRANAMSFREMLTHARMDHPQARIVIKTHPETAAGFRAGYFTAADADHRTSLCDTPASPWALLQGAIAVYVVSSQMGFEAILAGHRPQVFGRPFYAGWGLSDDLHDLPRRQRRLTAAQLFAGAMIRYPVWYDPGHDRLCEIETVIDWLEARARAWRDDRAGWVAQDMRLWKRAPLQAFFGTARPLRFATGAPRARAQANRSGARRMIWAAQATPDDDATRVEDGFLRSRGLGADLVPPLSLVLDDLGIYYDPSRESRLDRWITRRSRLRPDQQARAETLVQTITTAGLSKYNIGQPPPALPPGHRILVPGQVEDDASIRLGAGPIRSNRALLEQVRTRNPDAVILYKPHPDVTAGLRPGTVADAEAFADLVLDNADPAQLLTQVQEVWTMTSLMGFEALLRGLRVTTLGMPFYAGWGLTRDDLPRPAHRQTYPTLAALAHATLIDYPRYLDPTTRQPCPPELIASRLAQGRVPRRALSLRLLAKAQGALAAHAWLWRR